MRFPLKIVRREALEAERRTWRTRAEELGARARKWKTRAAAWKERAVILQAQLAGRGRSSVQDTAALEQRLRELERCVGALESRACSGTSIGDRDGAPTPPPRLRYRVGGTYDLDAYLATGRRVAQDVLALLDTVGFEIARGRRICDFGCGAGRVLCPLRPFLADDAEVHALDIDAEAIGWAARCLGAIGSFQVIGDLPPLRFPDGFFDLVFAVSVFTHLPASREDLWIRELARVVAPDGIALLTYHGTDLIPDAWTPETAVEREGGFLYFHGGKTDGLPDYYQVSFHTEEELRARWGRHLEIVSIHPRSINGQQGAVLARPRPG